MANPTRSFRRDIGIEAAIVLRSRKVGLIDGEVVLNVGNVPKVLRPPLRFPSARARGGTWAVPTGVLALLGRFQREQRRIQRWCQCLI